MVHRARQQINQGYCVVLCHDPICAEGSIAGCRAILDRAVGIAIGLPRNSRMAGVDPSDRDIINNQADITSYRRRGSRIRRSPKKTWS